jgi:putative heme-binding domain-containing protein
LEANIGNPKRFVADAARLAAASPIGEQHRIALTAVLASRGYRQAGLTGFITEVKRRGVQLSAIETLLDEAQRRQLDHAFTDARSVAQDAKSSPADRGEAIDLLTLTNDSPPLISALATDDLSQEVRLRSIAALASLPAMEPWQALVAGYVSESPSVQRAILDGLLSREDRTTLLLDEVAAGRMRPAALDAARIAQLLKHHNESIRRRAEKLFSAAVPADRQQVLADYRVVLDMSGDPHRGRDTFAKHCATCHKVGDVGVNFAPDISDSREKMPEQLLTDILQPNRAVDSNYFSYTALTTDGLAVTGILAAETSTSVTLKEAADKATTLRRDEIDQLASNGVSLMPDGLEREIPPQDMADLIAFIKNWRYLDTQAPPAAK